MPVLAGSSYYANNNKSALEIKNELKNTMLTLATEYTLNDIHTNINQNNVETYDAALLQQINYYNRFKYPNINVALSTAFPYAFFTKPDCNFFSNGSLNYPNDQHILCMNPTTNSGVLLIKELQSSAGNGMNIMNFLSNMIVSIDTQDLTVDTGTVGETYAGYKITYGKHNVSSLSSGSISVSFNDTRELQVYHLLNLWINYISDCYRGIKYPKMANITDKILDYCCGCYYFITADDGETIIYSNKYYGCFPSNVSSSQLSMSSGAKAIDGTTTQTTSTIQYSMRKENSTSIFAEFNYASIKQHTIPSLASDNAAYITVNGKSGTLMKVFNSNLYRTGNPLAYAPIIVKETDSYKKTIYKLKFVSSFNI